MAHALRSAATPPGRAATAASSGADSAGDHRERPDYDATTAKSPFAAKKRTSKPLTSFD